MLIGYGEGQRIQYIGERLQPLWNDNGKGEVKELMKAVGNRYQKLKEECNKLDNLWNNKAFQVGDKTFAEQILPSYRLLHIQFPFRTRIFFTLKTDLTF